EYENRLMNAADTGKIFPGSLYTKEIANNRILNPGAFWKRGKSRQLIEEPTTVLLLLGRKSKNLWKEPRVF
ncbi:MAG: hypothetical protein IKM73_02685, partial [Acidaminococcaceae bacterium]|nr:hypothetical protein [Acidaminococcaceae bacterium]